MLTWEWSCCVPPISANAGCNAVGTRHGLAYVAHSVMLSAHDSTQVNALCNAVST